MNLSWDDSLGQWHGECPRCGSKGFFTLTSGASISFGSSSMDVVRCPSRHLFVVEYYLNNRAVPHNAYPVERTGAVPTWLPEEFHDCYIELLKNLHNNHYRSVIALSGILLEAAVNEQITNPGDKGKSLFERLEGLINKGTIDADQFSEATITRLTRKGVIHPKEIAATPSDSDAKDVFNSVNYFLERTYKPRASKALKAPEQKGT